MSLEMLGFKINVLQVKIFSPESQSHMSLGTQHPNKRSSMMYIHEQRSQIGLTSDVDETEM